MDRHTADIEARLTLRKLSAILLFCLCSIPRARAEATLFLGEPYGYDGALYGTGHVAVYLSRVCATSPVELRPCGPGESGVVVSRYRSVAGYDWIAIPLIPYLYAVEKPEDIPLFADAKLVAFLRDRYRRDHLEALVPDLPNGGAPNGAWYELIGASYIRTIYAFEIETNPEQDAALIEKLNRGPNRRRWNLFTANCADFVREIINFYHPHAVHRSIVVDLGVTAPKQVARTLTAYSKRHPELRTAHYVIPQVPSTVPRSTPVKNVVECALTAKKYMMPLFALHPYIAGSMIVAYVGHWRFDPSRNARVLNSKQQLDAPLTRMDRRAAEGRLQELLWPVSVEDAARDAPDWASLRAAAEPVLDAAGGPRLQVRKGGEVTLVGVARANIMSVPEGFDFAAGLVKARLREELKPAAAHKTARADVESDLALLQKLLTLAPRELATSETTATIDELRPLRPGQ